MSILFSFLFKIHLSYVSRKEKQKTNMGRRENTLKGTSHPSRRGTRDTRARRSITAVRAVMLRRVRTSTRRRLRNSRR